MEISFYILKGHLYNLKHKKAQRIQNIHPNNKSLLQKWVMYNKSYIDDTINTLDLWTLILYCNCWLKSNISHLRISIPFFYISHGTKWFDQILPVGLSEMTVLPVFFLIRFEFFLCLHQLYSITFTQKYTLP